MILSYKSLEPLCDNIISRVTNLHVSLTTPATIDKCIIGLSPLSVSVITKIVKNNDRNLILFINVKRQMHLFGNTTNSKLKKMKRGI